MSAIWLHHGSVEPLSMGQLLSVKTEERATHFLQKTNNEKELHLFSDFDILPRNH